jgi:hypothetical protein
MDEVVRIAVIRRARCPACVPTLALSLFVVGLIDAAALMPIGAAAAATSGGPPAVQAGLSGRCDRARRRPHRPVAPRLMASGRLIRFR